MTAVRLFLFFLLFGSNLLPTSPHLRVGVDRVMEEPYVHWFQGKRLGLITNPTGVNSDFQPTAEILAQIPQARLTALFAPEHGIEGSLQAGAKVPDSTNVYSLYGARRRPTPEMLRQVDVLVYDLQDVGVRFYTYISTLLESLKACADRGIPLVVLDRPNPIRGDRVEGPVLEAGHESFLGPHRLPIRYGLTPGELASLLNAEARLGCDLRIVALQGWSRQTWHDETSWPWIPPSPNMPSLSTALVYPGFALIEGTNLSEGRGTSRPFELIGAPWLRSQELARRLNALGLPGVHFRPQAFTPTFSKHRDEHCQGVQVHVLDRDSFQPIPAALHLLDQIRRLHPQKFRFRKEHFDRLCGNHWIRESLQSAIRVDVILEIWASNLKDFQEKRASYLLYSRGGKDASTGH